MTEATPAPQAPGPYHNYSIDQLHATLVGLALNASTISATKGIVEAEIERRFSKLAVAAYDEADKTFGQMTVALPDPGFNVKAEIKKTVKWDSAVLQKIATDLLDAGKLTWPAVQKLFKIVFEVPEKTYSAIFDEELKGKLDTARTVKFDEKPKLTLVKVGE